MLFERGTGYDRIDAAVGACGAEPGCSSGKVGKPYEEIVRCATERGALVIPAHVNGPNGLFTVLQGQASIRAWRDEAVHAVAVSPGLPLTELQARILDNSEREYQRRHPVARLHADDQRSRAAHQRGWQLLGQDVHALARRAGSRDPYAGYPYQTRQPGARAPSSHRDGELAGWFPRRGPTAIE